MAEVISVRFRSGAKNYYFDPRGLTVQPGQYVVVETAQGIEYAKCTEGSHEVPDEAVIQPLRGVVRIATENDHKAAAYNRRREKEAVGICEQKIAAHGLEMKLVNVECSFEGNKIIFFFTADGRVDFRELVRDLAGVFRARIELRQIGVRDEAKMLGGIGICGRPLCCSQFLDEFIPVSIKMAKTQNLSLNPAKISGACGRLMCCLKYEQAAYEDAAKRMPKAESFVDTPDGIGNVSGVDLLREQVQVRLDSAPESPKRYKNTEIRVLRNGKGSREGIEIPKEHPQRQTLDTEVRFKRTLRESIQVPALLAEDREPLPGGERPNNRRRNNNSPRRSGGKGRQNDGKRPDRRQDSRAKMVERVDRIERVEKLPVRITSDVTAEKKAAADRAARQQGDGRPPDTKATNHSRPYRKPRQRS